VARDARVGAVLAGGRRLAYNRRRGVFYAAKRMRYGHFVWHLFVMTGSACPPGRRAEVRV
jgi:hypothetical protein